MRIERKQWPIYDSAGQHIGTAGEIIFWCDDADPKTCVALKRGDGPCCNTSPCALSEITADDVRQSAEFVLGLKPDARIPQ